MPARFTAPGTSLGEPVAQLVEHGTFNLVVVGSIPTRLTTPNWTEAVASRGWVALFARTAALLNLAVP